MNDRRHIGSLYFVNVWVDTASIGGLSILTAVILALFSDASEFGVVSSAVFPLALLVNYPHFSATVYRLYQNPENLRQFPVTAIGLPVLLVGAVTAGLYQPELIAPYFVMLYLLWSPYHYSGQTVGLTMVYARRAGFRIGRRERLSLASFVFSAFLCGVWRIQSAASHDGLIDISGLAVPALPFPVWLYWGAQAVMTAGGLLVCGFALAWCLREPRLLPPLVPFPAVVQLLGFVPAP